MMMTTSRRDFVDKIQDSVVLEPVIVLARKILHAFPVRFVRYIRHLAPHTAHLALISLLIVVVIG
jgi:hypothetical protein